MKRLFTSQLQMNAFSAMFVSMCFILSACSASDENLSSSNGKGVETITIQNDEGETVIKMRADEVLSVEKNGEEFSKEERDNYMKELESKPGFFTWFDISPKFHFDKSNFDMKHFSDDSLVKKLHFDFDFDHGKFREKIKGLHEKLDSLKFHKYEFNFDDEQFQEQMKQLECNLQNITIDIPDIKIDFDEYQFETGMSELMENLDDEMEKFDFNMDELNEELKKFNEFIKDIKNEMVKDGLLSSADEEINIDFNSEELKINDKSIPDKLKEKYKRMYEKHFGTELNGDNHFYFND